mmetsp:Transcript_39464/g.103511  ORF Transcript_39464/g.103511 Transcript_39464/m.103511 type:complete len:137 (-) Transcript_39464:137-547(-)
MSHDDDVVWRARSWLQPLEQAEASLESSLASGDAETSLPTIEAVACDRRWAGEPMLSSSLSSSLSSCDHGGRLLDALLGLALSAAATLPSLLDELAREAAENSAPRVRELWTSWSCTSHLRRDPSMTTAGELICPG